MSPVNAQDDDEYTKLDGINRLQEEYILQRVVEDLGSSDEVLGELADRLSVRLSMMQHRLKQLSAPEDTRVAPRPVDAA